MRHQTKGNAVMPVVVLAVLGLLIGFLAVGLANPTLAQMNKSGQGSGSMMGMMGMMGQANSEDGKPSGMKFPDSIFGDIMALMHLAHGAGSSGMMGMMGGGMMGGGMMSHMMQMMHGSGSMMGGHGADGASSHHGDKASEDGADGDQFSQMWNSCPIAQAMASGEDSNGNPMHSGPSKLAELSEKYPDKARKIRYHLKEAKRLIEELYNLEDNS